jgi:hypothetical protein
MTGNTDMHLWSDMRKTVSIWRDHYFPQATRNLSFAWSWSGCWLWLVECCPTPLQWLCEVARYWLELKHPVVHVGKLLAHTSAVDEVAYGREINIQLYGNSSGGHSCSQHANCMLPQLETSAALCCDKIAHCRVTLYCPQHKVHLCKESCCLISFFICHSCQVDVLSWQRRNAH